ncbi:LPXTG-motif cell wall-anchored protein [Rhodococcus sp. OK519]|nr:LPXTG-motif cell wall-anchored protein [Rhodococcus sp. OK519]
MVSRWAALGMILAVLALVVSSFSIAPVASANPSATSTTPAPTRTAESPSTTEQSSTPAATTSESPATTTKAPAATTSDSPVTTTKAPAATTSEAPATTASVAPTTAQRSAAVTSRGLNPGIEVKITDIQVENKNGQQIKVGDSVTVKGTWDAREADPKPGDQFTVQFPDELKLDANPRIDLVGGGAVWGTCELVATTNLMTCVLSDAVADKPEDVYGDFEVFTKAVEYTTAEEVDFEINGAFGQSYPLPGGGGISDGKDVGAAKKSGKLQSDKQAVRWTIDIPGADLAALDATGDGSVTLSDTLSSNMKLCDDGRLNAKLLSGRPGDLKAVADGVTVTQPGGAGAPVTIAIANGGAFKSDMLYRVEYTSCTTSGEVDALGTVYDNAVAIGDKNVGSVGVGQDWTPATEPSKSGSLDKGKRYKEAAWTIMVPGTFIAGSAGHEVTVSETLTGAHVVCEGGLQLKVEKANYLPGPNGSAPGRTNVTGEFTIVSTATPGAKNFSVTITPKDIDTFNPEQYYYVSYRTCLTEDEVPDNTDVFTNSASLNGRTPVTATAKGPEFKGGKSGQLNTADRDVAGEKQPAGTTLDWKVEIPGQHLEGLEAPAVISDTFSGTMTVCEVGADLKANLNLRVIARDFLGDKAVAERDLTATTGVVRTAGGIDITLPMEAYDRETRYFIDYTLCTTSGGLDGRGTVYGNSLTYQGRDAITSSVKQEWGGGGTGTGVSRGSFTLLKEAAPSSKEFPEDTEFTVKVEEFAPGKNPATDKPDSSYNVKVKADGTPVSGVNPRGTGWQIRLSEIDLPRVDGVYFEQGKFRPAAGVTLNEDKTQAVVTIAPKTNIGVTLVNNAVLGKATITKTVVGDGLGDLTGNESFVIKAQIDDDDAATGAEVREITLKKDQHFELTGLPIGAKVTFTEVLPLNTDRVTWSEPVINPKTLTIGTNAAANAVSVTNEAKITYGSFDLKKSLTGPEAFNKNVPATFDVLATWTDAAGPQSKTLALPKDGSPVSFGENLPGGTKVTLTETVPANGSGLAWGVPAYTGDVTTGAPGSAVVTIGKDRGQVEVKNFVDTNDGTLRIVKQIGGEAAEAVGDDEEFTVQARWKDGTEYVTQDLTVKQGVATPLGVALAVGTEVTFTEKARPGVDAVEWGTIAWGTDPSGDSWLVSNADGTATGIVSDAPNDGRLVTLTNEALWKYGSVEFAKFILNGDDLISATDADLPEGAEFEVRVENIDPALPEGTDFPAVGETITLDAGNGFSWKSGDVLPRNTVVTFSEVDPAALPGISWARPYYYVAADAGDPDYRDTVTIEPGAEAVVEIHNRPIPTTDVDIDKIVTGPKGNQVAGHESTTFQVTATWMDVDDEARSCVLDVKPGASVTPTAECDAAVVDGRVQFPVDTEITFAETGAFTDVTNVKWGEVVWSVKDGSADVVKVDGASTAVSVTLTGDANESVVLGLENKTSSNGLIIIPLPIPLPPWGGSLIPPGSGSGLPTPPVTNQPGEPVGPGSPVGSGSPEKPSDTGHNGAPGKPAPSKPAPDQSSLPVTGANVVWIAGAALVLIAGGAWLTLRNRRRMSGEG